MKRFRPAASSSPSRLAEAPLVAFTLCGQAAAGLAVLSLITGSISGSLPMIGVLLAAGALASLLHLGTVSQAWRAPAQFRTSPLSREILMLAAFAVAWVLALVAPVIGSVAMAACGMGYVYAMGDVYRVETVPGWETWRIHSAFATSAILLGGIGLVLVLATTSPASTGLMWLGGLASVVAVTTAVVSRLRFYERIHAKFM